MKKSIKIILAVVAVVACAAAFGCDATESGNGNEYTRLEYDETYHWNANKDYERDEKSVAKHVDENDDGKCDECGYNFRTRGHEHEFTKYGNDETYHWKECAYSYCHERDEQTISKHVEFYGSGECSACGYVFGEGHTHVYDKFSHDTSFHYYVCSECGKQDLSTEEAHVDADRNGKCDECGFGMKVPLKESAGLYTSQGIGRCLRIDGEIPSGAKCLKLRYSSESDEGFVESTSGDKLSYVFTVPLTEFNTDKKPYTFEICAYDKEKPSSTDEPYETTAVLYRTEESEYFRNLEAGELFFGEDVTYRTIENEDNLLTIVAYPTIQNAITSVTYRLNDDGKPTLTVSGTKREDKIVVMQITDNNNSTAVPVRSVSNTAADDGEFYCTIDLSSLGLSRLDDEDYDHRYPLSFYFYIMTYPSVEESQEGSIYSSAAADGWACINNPTQITTENYTFTASLPSNSSSDWYLYIGVKKTPPTPPPSSGNDGKDGK